jgi:plastocyanin
MDYLKRKLLAPGILTLSLGLAVAGIAPTFAQENETDGEAPVAALHPGTCEAPEDTPIADLGALAPYGEMQEMDATYRGTQTDVQPVWSTNVTLELPFEQAFAEQQPHALAIHESAAGFGTLLACGDLAGYEVDGRVVTGLFPVNGSGVAGVAIVDQDQAGLLGLGEDQTQFALFVLDDLMPAPEEAPAEAPAATPVPDGAAAPADDEEAAPDEDEAVEEVTVEAVDIDFNPNEFSIPANTDVPVTLTNTGSILHTFTIDELGIDEELHPGETREITINADAGEYVYYCTVPGHRQAGQEGIMTVE